MLETGMGQLSTDYRASLYLGKPSSEPVRSSKYCFDGRA